MMKKIICEYYYYRWPLLLGVVLYFQMSWVPGFFQDGYLYAAFGKSAVELNHWLVPHASENVYNRFFHHQPFIFILEGLFFKVFGVGYTQARLFSGLFSLATLLTLIGFIKRKDKKVALYSAYLFVLIPPLMKKTRFPNLDLPLMLFVLLAMYSFWKAFEEKDRKYWPICGVFFGLAMLTKGPMAIFIPLSIFIYSIVSKQLIRLIKSKLAWGSLILGFVIWGIWPLSLKVTGDFDIFIKYIDFTFFNTMKDARGEPSPFYTYFLFLLKQTSIWILLLIPAIKVAGKNKIVRFHACIALCILLPLSLFKFKYSHYLLPLYPFLSVLSGHGLKTILSKNSLNFENTMKYLTVLVTIALLIFPLTSKTRRDKEIFQIRNFMELKKIERKSWYNVDSVYPYWSLHNLNAFEDYSNTININWNSFLESKDKGIFLIPLSRRGEHSLYEIGCFKTFCALYR